MIARLCLVAILLATGGCAGLAPKHSARLDEARVAHARFTASGAVAHLAPQDVRQADEALARAVEAYETLQDPAVVDHLAYLARQRVAIAEEKAKRAVLLRSLETGRRS